MCDSVVAVVFDNGSSAVVKDEVCVSRLPGGGHI